MGLLSRLKRPSRPAAIRSILIVEDEPLVAFDNEHALAQAGYRVVETVEHYDHATEAMARGGIDLVIADIRLAGARNGVDVARHAGLLAIPVLFSAGHCPDDARELAMGWLGKPYPPRDLIRAIHVIERILGGFPMGDVPEAMRIFVEHH